MSSSNPRKISRRDFLKLTATTAGAMAYLTACGGTGGGGATGPDLTSGKAIPLDDLIKAAKQEGELTTIAIPRDWANYGEAIDRFTELVRAQIQRSEPGCRFGGRDRGHSRHQGHQGPQAPDTVDVGIGYGPGAKEEGLCSKYFLSTWDTIPLKDAEGYWLGEYYGVLTFETIKGAATPPTDWEDLLKPEYKGKVAMAGDVLKSNESVMTVMASGISRAGGIDDTVESATAAAAERSRVLEGNV